MENTYIVAFKAGSSGRFVANLVWNLLTGTEYEYKLSEFNSTHHFSPYATSFDISKVPIGNRLHNDSNIYRYFNFTDSPGLITTHAFPDFDIINERYPNTKIIVISYDTSNVTEITGNSLLKNGFESFKNKLSNNDASFLQIIFKKEFNEPYVGQEIELEKKKVIFEKYNDNVKHEMLNSKFMTATIPEEYRDKVMVLQYSDICNNMEKVIDDLCNFTGKQQTQYIRKLYQDYMTGRNCVINEHMPWVLDK